MSNQKYRYELCAPSGEVVSFEFLSLEERERFRGSLNRLLTIYRKQLLQELQGKMDEIAAIETRL